MNREDHKANATKMESGPFLVHDHEVPCSHIRELPNALAVDEGGPGADLRLSVKQYVPKENNDPQPDDITIIFLHASTFFKELYEPLFEDLLERLTNGTRIRSIWVADIAAQGSSYALNEEKLATGQSWDDHPRDLLHMINTFKEQMVPPLFGIGHSMGGAQLVQLSKLHPRLFHSVSFLDGWFAHKWEPSDPKSFWKRATNKRGRFDDKAAACKQYEQTPVLKQWDKRVVQKYKQHGFRNTPTVLHPEQQTDQQQVASLTPGPMELHTQSRVTVDANIDQNDRFFRLQYPDFRDNLKYQWPYYQSAPYAAGEYLPHLRPRAIFLYGKKGSISRPEWQKDNLELTGTSHGGSGGAKLGCVQADVVAGGHFFPFENPVGTAQKLSAWLTQEGEVWKAETEELKRRFGHGRSARERQEMPAQYHEVTKTWASKRDSKL